MRSLPSTLVLASGLLLAAACGGETTSTIPAAVADDLAARAETLAAALEAGDPCGALGTAGELVRVTAARRDAGEVPEDIAAEVISATRDTVRDLTCEPEPAPPAPEDDGGEKDEGKGEDEDDDPRRGGEKDEDDDDKGKGKGKGRGKDGGDD